MYIYIHACLEYIFTHMHVYAACIYVAYAHGLDIPVTYSVYVCMYIYVYTYKHTYRHTEILTDIQTYRDCIYVTHKLCGPDIPLAESIEYKYMYVHIYICTYTFTHTYTHTHTYRHT